jgi:YcaO-like protein with predicted kinase domain
LVGPQTFGVTPIRSPGGHARSFAETDRWLTPRLASVPITRVYDATPLDYLGFPVWAAVTPLARDLTVHAGKGTTAPAARVSAVMEAIERICAEDVDSERVHVASFNELAREQVLDPALFDLPFQTTYRRDQRIAWVRGYDLLAERHVWVALDLVISPAREGVCVGVETNGLAAGNNHTEATVHAVYEVIERDAAAHEQFTSMYCDPGAAPPIRLIDKSSLPTIPAQWAEVLGGSGRSILLQDLSHDLEVPVFRATIADRSFPGREGATSRFEGLGADLDASRALARAIHEAAQSHTAVLVGARETFEDGQRHAQPGPAGLLARLLAPSSVEPFRNTSGKDYPDDLYGRLLILLERLVQAGFRHCVVVDLTSHELQVPVVRVLVPGAAGPYGDTTRRPALRLLRSLV